MKSLRSLFSVPSPLPTFDAPIEPGRSFYAIGDIHGCFDKLLAAVNAIKARDENARIVCVGDYIDRGEQSAQVLRYLSKKSAENSQLICLLGNHERMCLQFLDDPENRGERWLRYGGLQTLASFAISHRPGSGFGAVRDDLAAAMGADLVRWLGALPTYWISGNIAVTHAGADPKKPIGTQHSRNLTWGHPEFENTARNDDMWVVHGHTITPQPTAQSGRISVDTGAYATGRLTVAQVSKNDVSFFQV